MRWTELRQVVQLGVPGRLAEWCNTHRQQGMFCAQKGRRGARQQSQRHLQTVPKAQRQSISKAKAQRQSISKAKAKHQAQSKHKAKRTASPPHTHKAVKGPLP